MFEYLYITLCCSVMLEDIPVQNREEGNLPPADSQQPSGYQITNTTQTLPEENINEVTVSTC